MAVVRGAYPAGGEDIFLDVTVKDGFLAEGRWMTTVMVKCSRRGNRPAQRIPLTVRLDGRDYGATGAETDEQGVFNQYVGLPGPNPVGYFLSAQIPGTTVEAGEWIKAKADAPAKPEDPKLAKARRTVELRKLSVEEARIAGEERLLRTPATKPLGRPTARAAGDQGKYLISVHVPYEDGSPAKDVPVRLIVAKLGAEPEPVDLKTDANGFAVDEAPDLPYRLEFSQPLCTVTVQVAGREILMHLIGLPQQTADAAAAGKAEAAPQAAADAERDLRDKARAAGTKFADDLLAGLRGPAPAVPVVRPIQPSATDQPSRRWRFFRRRAN